MVFKRTISYSSHLTRQITIVAVPLASSALALCVRANQALPAEPGKHELVMHQGERDRYFVLYLPADFATLAKPVPLVVMLHGGGGHANNAIRMTGLNAKADEAGFIAVYPQAFVFNLRDYFLDSARRFVYV